MRPSVMDRVKKSRATAAVRRIGGTLGWRWNPWDGGRGYGGPSLLYLTNNRIPESLLPSMTWMPAAVYAVMSYIEQLLLEGEESSVVEPPVPVPITAASPFDLPFWQTVFTQWLALKTACVGVNVSAMVTEGSGTGLGPRSNLLLDLYPFRPALSLHSLGAAMERAMLVGRGLVRRARYNAMAAKATSHRNTGSSSSSICIDPNDIPVPPQALVPSDGVILSPTIDAVSGPGPVLPLSVPVSVTLDPPAHGNSNVHQANNGSTSLLALHPASTLSPVAGGRDG